jgi:histidinol dehydrogenase
MKNQKLTTHTTQVTMAAAHVAQADGLLKVGGSQAVAALSQGIGIVPKCDIIVGPGNQWVTAAKSLVSQV